MRCPPDQPASYWLQFRTTPLKLIPFDPKTHKIAKQHVKRLTQAISHPQVLVYHRGSTLFGIAGKGDIDIGIWSPTSLFAQTVKQVSSAYGPPKVTGHNFAAYYTSNIEVSLMKGYSGQVDWALTNYLVNHPKLIQDYLSLKEKFCYSKRAYLVERNIFLRKLISQI